MGLKRRAHIVQGSLCWVEGPVKNDVWFFSTLVGASVAFYDVDGDCGHAQPWHRDLPADHSVAGAAIFGRTAFGFFRNVWMYKTVKLWFGFAQTSLFLLLLIDLPTSALTCRLQARTFIHVVLPHAWHMHMLSPPRPSVEGSAPFC